MKSLHLKNSMSSCCEWLKDIGFHFPMGNKEQELSLTAKPF